MKAVFKNISFRLTMFYAALFFVGLVFVTAATIISVKYYMDQQSIQQMESISEAIRNAIHSPADINNENLNNITQMYQNIDIVLKNDTKALYSTSEVSQQFLPANYQQNTMQNIKIDGQDFLLYSSQFTVETNQLYSLQIIKDPDNDNSFLAALFWIMMLIDAFVLLFSILFGFIMSKRALTPINKIIRQAKNISASNLKNRIIINGPDDELKRLATTFNELIGRIEYSYEKQNRFTLDASHELATPLAVIKGYIDLIDRWGKDDRAVLNRGIQSIKHELYSINKLMDTLLQLSQSDNDMIKIEKTEFALNELMIEVVKDSRILAPNHTFELNKNDSIRIWADQLLIKQMIRALIDNAIKYSGENGTITIQVEKLKDTAAIHISDNGIGIPSDDLPYIFDRFYRVDRARSRSLGGVGLGLSIVKWIVNIHGGSISVQSTPGSFTQFDILLPIINS